MKKEVHLTVEVKDEKGLRLYYEPKVDLNDVRDWLISTEVEFVDIKSP